MRTGDASCRRSQYTNLSEFVQAHGERPVSATFVGRKIKKSGRTIHRWSVEGLFPRYRIGRQWRYLMSEILAAEPRKDRRRGRRTRDHVSTLDKCRGCGGYATQRSDG